MEHGQFDLAASLLVRDKAETGGGWLVSRHTCGQAYHALLHADHIDIC